MPAIFYLYLYKLILHVLHVLCRCPPSTHMQSSTLADLTSWQWTTTTLWSLTLPSGKLWEPRYTNTREHECRIQFYKYCIFLSTGPAVVTLTYQERASWQLNGYRALLITRSIQCLNSGCRPYMLNVTSAVALCFLFVSLQLTPKGEQNNTYILLWYRRRFATVESSWTNLLVRSSLILQSAELFHARQADR